MVVLMMILVVQAQTKVYLTLNILHDHAEMSARFERAEKADDERILGKREDVPLHKRLLDLVPQNQVLLVDLFHGKALTCLFMPHHKHSPERNIYY